MTDRDRLEHAAEAASASIQPAVLGVALRDNDWFPSLPRGVYLAPGVATPTLLRVPAGDAQRILRQTVRVVADVPASGAPDIVWVAGASELLIRPGGMELACASGLVTIGVPVACDQLPDGAGVTVPFAVGTEEAPSGLVMSTLVRPTGPAVIVDGWAEALTAFAWEALVHLAQSLCAATGKDSAGAPLIPAYLGAARDVLLLQPMARHRVAGRQP